mmetsp:Transcript_4108/g.13052  ORF Transcript_4108/g.13052 Transcript_4108/m.13052 type:complete len:451 (-) Transcript_4108:270-1622(-)
MVAVPVEKHVVSPRGEHDVHHVFEGALRPVRDDLRRAAEVGALDEGLVVGGLDGHEDAVELEALPQRLERVEQRAARRLALLGAVRPVDGVEEAGLVLRGHRARPHVVHLRRAVLRTLLPELRWVLECDREHVATRQPKRRVLRASGLDHRRGGSHHRARGPEGVRAVQPARAVATACDLEEGGPQSRRATVAECHEGRLQRLVEELGGGLLRHAAELRREREVGVVVAVRAEANGDDRLQLESGGAHRRGDPAKGEAQTLLRRRVAAEVPRRRHGSVARGRVGGGDVDVGVGRRVVLELAPVADELGDLDVMVVLPRRLLRHVLGLHRRRRLVLGVLVDQLRVVLSRVRRQRFTEPPQQLKVAPALAQEGVEQQGALHAEAFARAVDVLDQLVTARVERRQLQRFLARLRSFPADVAPLVLERGVAFEHGVVLLALLPRERRVRVVRVA